MSGVYSDERYQKPELYRCLFEVDLDAAASDKEVLDVAELGASVDIVEFGYHVTEAVGSPATNGVVVLKYDGAVVANSALTVPDGAAVGSWAKATSMAKFTAVAGKLLTFRHETQQSAGSGKVVLYIKWRVSPGTGYDLIPA